MDFLGIKDSTASRPSLISSIWSLQVQPQQDAVTTIMDMGSQQSLPDIMPSTTNAIEMDCSGFVDQTNSMRPSKSLSELSQFFNSSRTFRIHEAPSFIWKRQSISNPQQQPLFRPHTQDSTLSRQQKERNICEWLENLNCNDDSTRSRISAVSPTTNSAAAQKPPFPNSKPTPMQH